MSEYQYYEFLAVDRPLIASEMDALRDISSRASISENSFANEYHHGDLKVDPIALLSACFDVHVYVANWGDVRLALRLPRPLLSTDTLATYRVPNVLEVTATDDHVIIDLWRRPEEPEGWLEGPGWMPLLAGVRDLLLRGDQRALYLGWLVGVAAYEVSDEDTEPPVPPGLTTLPPSLTTFVEFFALSEHLVAAAAEASPPEPTTSRALAPFATSQKRAARSAPPRRSVADLRKRANEHREEARRRQEREAAEARRRQDAAETARLDALADRQAAAWHEVEQLVASKNQNAYDEAVALLQNLRDLAAREGTQSRFESRLADLRATHAPKRSFIRRLGSARLG